jgi:hypothetical protein
MFETLSNPLAFTSGLTNAPSAVWCNVLDRTRPVTTRGNYDRRRQRDGCCLP